MPPATRQETTAGTGQSFADQAGRAVSLTIHAHRGAHPRSLRYHLVGTILVALLLFVWGFLVHAVLHEMAKPITVIEDPAEAKLVALLDEIAPQSGTYFGKHGIFLSHDMTTDLTSTDPTGKLDQSGDAAMGTLLIRQLIINFIIAAFLSYIVLEIRTPGVVGKACCLGFVGLTGGIAAFVPQWS